MELICVNLNTPDWMQLEIAVHMHAMMVSGYFWNKRSSLVYSLNHFQVTNLYHNSVINVRSILWYRKRSQNVSNDDETKCLLWVLRCCCFWLAIVWSVCADAQTNAMPWKQNIQCALRLWVCSHLWDWTKHMCRIYSNTKLYHFMWHMFHLWCLL